MADREGLFADATCLAARTRGLISAVGLHPFGADLQSVCAAERRSHPSDEKTDGEGLPALRSGRLAALGSNFVLIPGEVSSLPSAKVADGEGFEPSVHCCTHAFQACAIDHSATHPERISSVNTDRRGPASRGQDSSVFHRSRSKRPVEIAAMAAKAMKRRSMNVFMPASRTQGVGHRLGEASIFLSLKAEFEPE
jgi:hypothetical protein